METSADAPDEFLQPAKSLLSHVHLGALAERGYPNWGDSTMSWRLDERKESRASPFPDFICHALSGKLRRCLSHFPCLRNHAALTAQPFQRSVSGKQPGTLWFEPGLFVVGSACESFRRK